MPRALSNPLRKSLIPSSKGFAAQILAEEKLSIIKSQVPYELNIFYHAAGHQIFVAKVLASDLRFYR